MELGFNPVSLVSQPIFLFPVLPISAPMNSDIIPLREMNLTFLLSPTVVNVTWNKQGPKGRNSWFVSWYRKLWNSVCPTPTHTILVSPYKCVMRLLFNYRATFISHTHIFAYTYEQSYKLQYQMGMTTEFQVGGPPGAGSIILPQTS